MSGSGAASTSTVTTDDPTLPVQSVAATNDDATVESTAVNTASDSSNMVAVTANATSTLAAQSITNESNENTEAAAQPDQLPTTVSAPATAAMVTTAHNDSLETTTATNTTEGDTLEADDNSTMTEFVAALDESTMEISSPENNVTASTNFYKQVQGCVSGGDHGVVGGQLPQQQQQQPPPHPTKRESDHNDATITPPSLETMVPVQVLYEPNGTAVVVELPMQSAQGVSTHVDVVAAADAAAVSASSSSVVEVEDALDITGTAVVDDMEPTSIDPSSKSRSQKTRLVALAAVALVVVASVTVGSTCANGACRPGQKSTPVPSSLAEQVVDYINSVTLTGQTLDISVKSIESTTMEEKALLRLLLDNTLNLPPTTPYAQAVWRQRYALATLLSRRSTFENLINECDWTGVECEWRDIGLDGSHNATVKLLLDDFGIDGPISSDVGLLSHLVHLDMMVNYMTGPIPNPLPFVGASLPHTVGLWSNLEEFYIGGRNNIKGLVGSLPSAIGQWTRLEHFMLRENRLTGSLPESIANWTNLKEFELGTSRLTGTLPHLIGTAWTQLEHFMIFEMLDMTGTLPTSIGQWTDMEYFTVHSTGLNGTLPADIAMWSRLEVFNVFSSELHGSVPTELCSVPSLTTLEADCRNINCSCASCDCM